MLIQELTLFLAVHGNVLHSTQILLAMLQSVIEHHCPVIVCASGWRIASVSKTLYQHECAASLGAA